MFKFKKKEKKVKEEIISKHNQELLKQYNEGRILRVDDKTDNKEYFKSLDDKIPKIEPKENE